MFFRPTVKRSIRVKCINVFFDCLPNFWGLRKISHFVCYILLQIHWKLSWSLIQPFAFPHGFLSFPPFVFRLNASLICAGVGTSCTSNSLNTFCISVYCRNSSALISDALCFSLLVQPFLTRCLSVSHFSTSILYPVVNSIRWLAKGNTHTDWHILCDWNTVFFAAFRCKMIFLLIFIIGCVWKWHPKIHRKMRYTMILRDI